MSKYGAPENNCNVVSPICLLTSTKFILCANILVIYLYPQCLFIFSVSSVVSLKYILTLKLLFVFRYSSFRKCACSFICRSSVLSISLVLLETLLSKFCSVLIILLKSQALYLVPGSKIPVGGFK